jgi:hypothetical protein
MPLSRRQNFVQQRPARSQTVVLQVEQLEDRTVLSHISGLSSPHHPVAHPHVGPEHRSLVCGAISQLGGDIQRQANGLVKQLDQKRKQIADQVSKQSQALTSAVNDKIRSRRDALSRLGNQARKAVVGAVQQQLGSVLNSKVVAYDLTTTGSLSANFGTGSYFAALDLGFGATLDTEALKSLTQGTIPIPNVNPLQAAAAALGFRLRESNGYQAARDAFLAGSNGNAYFASERFVRWFSPENLLKQGAVAVATGGASTASTMREMRAQLLLELNDIYSWLKVRGVQAAETLAGQVLGALVEGVLHGSAPNLSVPGLGLSVVGSTVPFSYTPEFGITGLPSAVLQKLEPFKAPLKVNSPHFAFGIVLSGLPSGGNVLQNEVNSFDQNKLSLAGGLDAALGSIINSALQSAPRDARQVLNRLLAGGFSSTFAESAARDRLFAALGLSTAELKKNFHPGNPVIDLTNSPVAARLAQFLHPLAQGNEPSVTIDRLEFNLSGYTLNMKVTLRHRQSWGTVAEALTAVNDFVANRGREIEAQARQFTGQVRQELNDLRQTAAGEIRNLEADINSRLNSLCNQAGNLLAQAQQQFLDAVHNAEEVVNSGVNAVKGVVAPVAQEFKKDTGIDLGF